MTDQDGDSDSDSVVVIVNAPNRIPVIGHYNTIYVVEGDAARIKPKGWDLDDDRLSYSINAPVGTSFRLIRGEFVWETDQGDAGEYLVELIASDGSDSTSQFIKVVVVDNAPSRITIGSVRGVFEPVISGNNMDVYIEIKNLLKYKNKRVSLDVGLLEEGI